MMKVELFIPCYIDQFFPDTGFNTVKILEKANCEVSFKPEQTCCGKPAFMAGFWDEAKQIGNKFLNDFAGSKYIVVPSTSCVGMIKEGFNDLFTNTMVHNQCRALQNNTFEIADFLVNVANKDYFGAELDGRAIFLGTRGELKNQNYHSESIQLLSRVLGLELIEINENIENYSYTSDFSLKYNALALSMAEQHINLAIELGAEYIISNDYSCLMQLNSYLHKNNRPIQTLHLVDVLAHGWLENPSY